MRGYPRASRLGMMAGQLGKRLAQPTRPYGGDAFFIYIEWGEMVVIVTGIDLDERFGAQVVLTYFCHADRARSFARAYNLQDFPLAPLG